MKSSIKQFPNAFNWDITQTPIVSEKTGKVITGYKEIIRSDDESTIAVMNDSYTPMTTAEFTNVVMTAAQTLGLEVASFEDWQNGETNMGRQRQVITAQLKVNEPLEIAGSKIDGYMTIGVGFDGSRSFYIGHSNSYLRCTNQFGSIITDFTSRLTKNNMLRVETIVKNIDTYKNYERKLYEEFIQLQDVKIDEGIIQECVKRLVKLDAEEMAMSQKELEDHLSPQKLNKMDEIMASMRGEIGDLGNNAWAMFNGVTHYTTHVMKARTQERFGNMFGAKNTMNQIGLNFAKSLLPQD